MNNKIQQMSNDIICELSKNDFTIQKYESHSTSSVYVKLDYGVCNTIRISDHPGKGHLKYRYNLIVGGQCNILEDNDFIRYYYSENDTELLLQQILFDRITKINRYGKRNYYKYMYQNQKEKKGEKGFWQDAKLVHESLRYKNEKNNYARY